MARKPRYRKVALIWAPAKHIDPGKHHTPRIPARRKRECSEPRQKAGAESRRFAKRYEARGIAEASEAPCSMGTRWTKASASPRGNWRA